MSTITQKEQLVELEKQGVTFIKTIDDVENLFSVESLNSDNPKIKTDLDVLIFFDTDVHNSSYVSDLLLEYIATYQKLNFASMSKMLNLDNKNVSKEIDFVNDVKGKIISQSLRTKLFYCQDENIYSKLFESYINKRFKNTNFEGKVLPIILTVKGNTFKKPKDIFIDVETLGPLTYNTIMKNMVLLYDYNQINL